MKHKEVLGIKSKIFEAVQQARDYYSSSQTLNFPGLKIMSLPWRSWGLLNSANSLFRRTLIVLINGGSISMRTMPKYSLGGYARILAKSESKVRIMASASLAFLATSGSELPCVGVKTSNPKDFMNSIIPRGRFSSHRIVSDIFSSFEQLRGVMESGFDMLVSKLWVVIRPGNFFWFYAGFQKLQDQIDHDSSSLKAGLPMANLWVYGYVIGSVHFFISLFGFHISSRIQSAKRSLVQRTQSAKRSLVQRTQSAKRSLVQRTQSAKRSIHGQYRLRQINLQYD